MPNCVTKLARGRGRVGSGQAQFGLQAPLFALLTLFLSKLQRQESLARLAEFAQGRRAAAVCLHSALVHFLMPFPSERIRSQMHSRVLLETKVSCQPAANTPIVRSQQPTFIRLRLPLYPTRALISGSRVAT